MPFYLTVDAAQQGIGSASCGPGVLPERRLLTAPSAFTVDSEADTLT